MGILSSSFNLRERLAQILFLFRENAADLFPRKVHRRPRDSGINTMRPVKKRKGPAHVATLAITEDLDAEDFPEQLEGFAKDVITFLDCLNEFPEFTDEAVNTSIISLEGDLKVRTVFHTLSCLNSIPVDSIGLPA